jgi:hypothetical protein
VVRLLRLATLGALRFRPLPSRVLHPINEGFVHGNRSFMPPASTEQRVPSFHLRYEERPSSWLATVMEGSVLYVWRPGWRI